MYFHRSQGERDSRIHLEFLIITEIHSWFWAFFYVLPKQDASQTLIHGTINYFEKVLIKNNLSSAPPSVRILCDQAAEAVKHHFLPPLCLMQYCVK